jgi:hypothetical protein
MKLTVNTKRYSLGTRCNCPKANDSSCGINYRAGF